MLITKLSYNVDVEKIICCSIIKKKKIIIKVEVGSVSKVSVTQSIEKCEHELVKEIFGDMLLNNHLQLAVRQSLSNLGEDSGEIFEVYND
jgi:hypothetical protein